MNSDLLIDVTADVCALTWREAAPVSKCPEDTMTDWSLVEVRYGEISILGTSDSSGKTRLTSPIVGVEAGTRLVTTSSGRRYRLMGRPGRTETSDAVLAALIDALGKSVRVVTDALRRANHISVSERGDI